jgi:methionyl-tRNA formyltransferase
MDIVFFGAPDFAAQSLRALLGSGHNVLAVVSQPDRPKGRSGQAQPTAVSALADSAGIPTLKPENVNNAEFLAELSGFNADIFVVAAYGQIMRRRLLSMPKHGAINVHASLLPKFRGASPIHMAIVNGETETGISIMQMDRGVDTGDVLHMEKIAINDADTYGTLQDKLAVLGGRALLAALEAIENGTAVRTAQEEGATHAPLLTKEMGRLDFTKTAREAANHVRGFNPQPGTFAEIGGSVLKIWEAAASDLSTKLPPGAVHRTKDRLYIACKSGGMLEILELQASGKKRMRAAEYLKGRQSECLNYTSAPRHYGFDL